MPVNRALRIFPALHICVLLSIIAVALPGYFGVTHPGFLSVALLYLANTTFFQFYNPAFMRGFGNGVLNGSLWTICVELQFYFQIPLVYRTLISKHRTRSNYWLLAMLVLSLLCNRLLNGLQDRHGTSIAWKLAVVSFLPWLYMFLTGVLAQRNFEFLGRFGARTFWLALPLYTACARLTRHLGYRMDNSFSPLLFFPWQRLCWPRRTTRPPP
jgi:peptidoglycan/LPS O-acetylase OafA/YrhL